MSSDQDTLSKNLAALLQTKICDEGRRGLLGLTGAKAWDNLDRGDWFLWALREYYGEHEPCVVLRHLPDQMLDIPIGATTLRADLQAVFSAEVVEKALDGQYYAINPLDAFGDAAKVLTPTLETYARSAGKIPTYGQLNELAYDWHRYISEYHPGHKQFLFAELADRVREAYAMLSPLWMADLSFYVICSADVTAGESLNTVQPPHLNKYWTITEAGKNEYAYLDDDRNGPWARGKHRKYVAPELPLWALVDWASARNFHFEDVNTMGSITDEGWLPAFALNGSYEHVIMDAYVTPRLPQDHYPENPWTDAMWEEVREWLKKRF